MKHPAHSILCAAAFALAVAVLGSGGVVIAQTRADAEATDRPAAPPAGAKVADEGQLFTLSTSTIVRFGAGTRWITKTVIGGGFCTIDYFGGDPAPATHKACYSDGAAKSQPMVKAEPPAARIPPGDAVFDAAGKLDVAAYRNIAANMSTDIGIAYRYGQPSKIASDGLPTWYKRPDIKFTPSQQPFADPRPDGLRTHWQVGGPPTDDAAWYFSNMANAAFVADDPAKSSGVSVYQQVAAGNNTYSQLPEISWIYPDGINDLNATVFRSRGLAAFKPVAIARALGRPGWNVQAIVAYQSGLIANARGSNNALNEATAQLDPGMVPTGIVVTNSGEFALVTVWDTVAVRGRVAVIALAGLCNSCTVDQPRKDTYWGEWDAPYPGLPNLSNFAFMKLLGYVELPDMKAPTEIFATTGVNPWTGYGQTTRDRYFLNLRDEANRQTFVSGGNVNAYARTGVAVVLSKSERKATFIDLKPLFAYYRKMYFGARADFEKTSGLGSAPTQWPFTFSTAPEQRPSIIKTVDLENPPTAVRMTLWTPWNERRRAWIATEEGTLHTFDLGNYVSKDGGGNPAEIRRTATLRIGANPVGLNSARAMNGSSGYDVNATLLVASRGERKVQWVDLWSMRVTRTLQDSRLIDPMAVDDNEGNGSIGNILSIADYAGKAISNYRYGPVVLSPGFTACQKAGCPTTDAKGAPAPFEYAGSLRLPGKVFGVTGANVP